MKISSTSSDIPYLVRAWVTRVDNMAVADKWVVTPPVYRLNENGAVQLRLYLLDNSGLPGDRESVFYLNVLSIPEHHRTKVKRKTTVWEGK
ncbi:putative fimbrial chaperone protein [Salmonella enterica subsp. arizonae]|nr:putative fimbrial chaperone protein [Salmonella enterica subsp. arizonae]